MANPRIRKTVAKAMVKRKGNTAVGKQTVKKKRFTNPSTIHDAQLRARFDKEKSWMENLASTDLKDMYEDCLPQAISAKAAWTLPKLGEDQLRVVQRLVEAHGGENFKKMSFDRKLNLYQWTESQCEKHVKLLLVDNRTHTCEEGKCLCGSTPNSSYVSKEGRIRK